MQDYQDADSRCSVEVIRNLLDASGDGITTQAEAKARMGNPAIQRFMRGIVTRLPSEWHKGSIATRWNWLTQEGPDGTTHPTHLTRDDFPDFQRHAEALGFWEDAALEGIDRVHWHLHPIKFIEHYRKCGWLSSSEFQNVVPDSSWEDGP